MNANKKITEAAIQFDIAAKQIAALTEAIEGAPIVINNPKLLRNLFSSIAEETAEQAAKSVHAVIVQQQEQISMLTDQVSQLTGMVAQLLQGITITTTETKTTITEVKVNEEVVHQEILEERRDPKTSKYVFIHVPTTESGRIRWKKNGGMTEEEVALQVLYELQQWNGVDTNKLIEHDHSMYMAIKSRFVGRNWESIVDGASRFALK